MMSRRRSSEQDSRTVVHIAPASFGGRGIYGGGERYPYELARAMADQVPTKLVTFGESHERFNDGPLEIEVLPVRHTWKDSSLNPISARLPLALNGSSVIHIHQWNCLLANMVLTIGKSKGSIVVATDHGGYGKNYRKELRLHRLLDRFLPVSAFSASLFPELTSKTELLFGGVDVARFAPDPGRPRERQALFVGRLMPHKGVDVLIDALDSTTRLVVMGRRYNDVYWEYLQDRAQGKNVTFVTDASDQLLIDAYQSSRVVVLPSQYKPTFGPPAKLPELFPLTLLEASACATPVVCTAVGGMPEFVIDGTNGFVVEPRDEARLRSAVETLLEDDSTWQRMSEEALERARGLSWPLLAEHCLEVYKRLR